MGDRLRDRFGAELTTTIGGAVAPWERAVAGLLAHRKDTAAHLAAALAADPELAVAHCVRGLAFCFLARRDLHASAHASLEAAQRSLSERGGTPREHALVAALESCCNGDMARAPYVLTALLDRDPLVSKLDHALRFMRGDVTGMLANAERAVDTFDRDTAGAGYVHGMLAFAREESGDYRGAERAARTAIELAGDDAWGAHALAHVYQMCERPAEGRRWLEASAHVFEGCNNFAGHVAWHRAIFAIEVGDHDGALALWDEISVHPPGDFREVTNGASLLWRLEEAGICVGDRWHALAERVLPLAHDHGYAFADAHYALTLMRANKSAEARAMLSSLRRYVLADRSPDARVQRELGLPLVEGIIALEEGRAEVAFDALSCTRAGAQQIGGSHAQRDVLRRMWITAAVLTNDPQRRGRAVREYLSYRPASTWAMAQ